VRWESVRVCRRTSIFCGRALAYNLIAKNDDGTFSLSEIGRKIVAPTRPGENQEAIVQAVLTPVVLSRFFTDYNGSPMPAEEHIGNILERKYGVPRERIEEAKAIITANGVFAGILRADADGSMWIRLDPKSTGITVRPTITSGDGAGDGVEPTPDASPGASAATTGELDKVCFVITPIGEDDSDERRHANMVLKSVIEPVIVELGLTARLRGPDRQGGHHHATDFRAPRQGTRLRGRPVLQQSKRIL